VFVEVGRRGLRGGGRRSCSFSRRGLHDIVYCGKIQSYAGHAGQGSVRKWVGSCRGAPCFNSNVVVFVHMRTSSIVGEMFLYSRKMVI